MSSITHYSSTSRDNVALLQSNEGHRLEKYFKAKKRDKNLVKI